MARYILIEVDDNEAAGDLVAAIERGESNLFFYKQQVPLNNGDDAYVVVPLTSARVRALFGRPTNFCECKPIGEVVVGKKFGWQVCTKCGKAVSGLCHIPRNLLAPPEQTPAQRPLYLGIWEPAKPAPTYGTPIKDPHYRGKRDYK